MRPVRVSLDAQTDLLEIWTYLFERSESTAARIIHDITSVYDALGENPGMGRSREELGPGFRSLPVGKYVIFYRVYEERIYILRVLHGARDTSNIYWPVYDVEN